MSGSKLTLLFISAFLLSPGAQAANREAKERAAKRACLNGEPTKGVQILTDLFIDSNDPTYLYNQGRCFEQNNRYEEAIGRFREYLRKVANSPDANKSDAQGAQKHITDCQAVLAKRDGGAPQAAAVAVPQPVPAAQAQAPLAPIAPTPMVMVQPMPPPDRNQGSGLRIAGVVTTAVGVAALVAGVGLNLKANGMVSDLEKRYSASDYSSSKSYKNLSQVSYGAGAVLVVGGAVMYYLGWRAGERVTLAPTVATGGAGAVLIGAF
ncbi:MAG TPA: hypothetical protein VIM14_19635 [Polyangia bacterium]